MYGAGVSAALVRAAVATNVVEATVAARRCNLPTSHRYLRSELGVAATRADGLSAALAWLMKVTHDEG